jgi:vacuolar-type H+-ATPase subunit H
MDARVELPASPEVDAAIMRVLSAEQAARAEVERCKRDAERTLDDAQRRARDIAERAARRAARVHRWTEAAIASRLAALDSQRATLLTAAGQGDDEDALSRAVDRVADELIGGGE